MKREFTNEDFEHFLKHSADNLRMKAPEKIWQNLSKELNKRRRRLTFKYGAVLLLASVLGYFAVSNIELKKLPVATVKQQKTITGRAINNENLSALKRQSNQPSKSIAYRTKQKQKKTNVSVLQAFTTDIENSAIAPDRTEKKETAKEDELLAQSDFTPTIVDSYDEPSSQPIKQTSSPNLFTTHSALPLTIESVINTYRLQPKAKKLQTAFYISPTISYRKLAENKSYLRNMQLNSTSAGYSNLYYNVNSMVTHKPDLGFEIGVSEKYSFTPKLRVLGGLQFNVNRYDIKAFSSPLSIATIALNTRGTRADSVTTITSLSNVNGYKSNWLQNFSFQISAPLGIELAIRGSDKMQLGIGTSVQPTYVLGDRSYLITTDYKSYTQVPWLLRRWNVNTAFETFVSYQSGKTRWQFGPQVRYQLLSSFIGQYPVKENLFDFGVKIGVSMNK